MKKEYCSPEFNLMKVKLLEEVLLTSSPEITQSSSGVIETPPSGEDDGF